MRWTIWGPVIGTDFMGRLRAARWVGHAPDRLGASLMPLERVRTLEEAFEAANGAGVPGQNLVLGERSGRIGWTISAPSPTASASTAGFPPRGATGCGAGTGGSTPAPTRG